MNHLKFSTNKTAHVYTHGEATEKTQNFWFITHGYGQLASNIIRKFEQLDQTTNLVVSPEALNRFYWRFKESIVGASWMTKGDRLDEIEDYTNYLTVVYEHFLLKLPPSVKIHFLGFSQGATTQMRWLCSEKKLSNGEPIRFDQLILWAGFIPDDIDYQLLTPIFEDKKLSFVCGDADEFITPDRLKWHLNFMKEKGLKADFVPFIGKHEILIEVLEQFF